MEDTPEPPRRLSELSDAQSSVPTDDLLRALADRHRRFAVAYLRQNAPASTMEMAEALADHRDDVPVDRLQAKLHHVHLPQLDDAGLIRYDADRNVADAEDALDEAGRLLDVS